MITSEKENRTQSAPNALIADDDPALLSMLTHLLEQEGFKVRTVRDGNQCLQMILQECPDVLITDGDIHGIDGQEICRQVRNFYSRKILPHYTYIFIISEQKDKKLLLDCLDAGADDFIERSSSDFPELKLEIKSRLKSAQRTRQLEQELEFSAKYDALTALLNRITFFDLALGVWERSIRNKFPLSAIMFDCDFFKRVNDIFGHSAGDAVLRTIADTIKRFSRSSDVVCRYGGEEFCVLLPGCNEKTAWNWAERIRKQFEVNPIKYNNTNIGVTVSFGIASRQEDVLTFDHLVERADQALIFAKQAGRNRCIRYSEIVACGSNAAASNCLLNVLFNNVSVAEIMTPFSLSLNENEKVSSTADFFLKTAIESLPVVNNDGELLGIVSEKNFLPLVGNINQWCGTVSSLVEPSVVSYPSDTPLQHIYDFLCRVSTNQILLLQGKKPVGFISRTSLLRWLRNQWLAVSGTDNEIIPLLSVGSAGQEHIAETMKRLSNELEKVCNIWTNEEADGDSSFRQIRLITAVSQAQDTMETVLRNFCTTTDSAENNTGNMAQLGFN
ncbi:hypothetical protein FACS18942_06680 [Planctomycetales bacterium]|nr:hypothetical protein FACS18942_06680 [Planctomycetales bacterium]